jgi:hypothetical protein
MRHVAVAPRRTGHIFGADVRGACRRGATEALTPRSSCEYDDLPSLLKPDLGKRKHVSSVVDELFQFPPSPTSQDGYPRGTVLATSDDSHSTPHVRELNTSLELGAGGGGEGTDLFKTVCWVGEAFQCADEMAPVASRARQASRNAQQDHGASEFDVRTVTPTHDDTKHPNPSKTFKAPSRDGEERSDSGSGYGYSEDDDDDARSGSGSENDAPSNDDADLDHHGLESKNLSSSEITVLYQNKRKCEEREERRVAARLARLDTNDCDAPRSFEDTKNRTKSDAETETWEMKRCARDQIFSSEGAFQRLYAELFLLQKTQGIWVNGTFRTCKVQAVEHDVYEWDVRFPASAFEVRTFPKHHTPPTRLRILVLRRDVFPLP